ncbi:MAG: hypothetical protein Q8M33_04575, partial [Hydrogenophaga sp.]|nr:hypothetical protein [Hydrogenophaga sp.]
YWGLHKRTDPKMVQRRIQREKNAPFRVTHDDVNKGVPNNVYTHIVLKPIERKYELQAYINKLALILLRAMNP